MLKLYCNFTYIICYVQYLLLTMINNLKPLFFQTVLPEIVFHLRLPKFSFVYTKFQIISLLFIKTANQILHVFSGKLYIRQII